MTSTRVATPRATLTKETSDATHATDVVSISLKLQTPSLFPKCTPEPVTRGTKNVRVKLNAQIIAIAETIFISFDPPRKLRGTWEDPHHRIDCNDLDEDYFSTIFTAPQILTQFLS